MRWIVIFLFAGILGSCKVILFEKVVRLNAHSKELFCTGAQHMINYINVNNKLPRDSDSSLVILPEEYTQYGVPPEIKGKLLNQEVILRKRRDRRKKFPLECASELAIKRYDLSRYYYDYDTAAKLIALVVVRTNEQYQKDEWIYFYGMLDSKGEIIKQDEFHWIDQKGKF